MKKRPSELTGFEAMRERIRGMKLTADSLIVNCEDDPLRSAIEDGERSLRFRDYSAADYWFEVAVFIEEKLKKC